MGRKPKRKSTPSGEGLTGQKSGSPTKKSLPEDQKPKEVQQGSSVMKKSLSESVTPRSSIKRKRLPKAADDDESPSKILKEGEEEIESGDMSRDHKSDKGVPANRKNSEDKDHKTDKDVPAIRKDSENEEKESENDMDVTPPEEDGLYNMDVSPPDIPLPKDRAGEELGEYSGGTFPSNYSGRKPSEYSEKTRSKYSGIKPSEYSGIKPSEYSGIKPSEYSGIKPSEYSGIKPSEYSGIKPSETSGVTGWKQFPSKISAITSPSKDSFISGVSNQRNTQQLWRTPNSWPTKNSYNQFVKQSVSDHGWEKTPGKGTKLWILGISILVLIAAWGIYQYFVGNPKELSPSGMEKVTESFLEMLNETQRRFPHQEPKFWMRSTVLLKKHLSAATHSEPSILMFAAALNAEKTMRCLSRSISGAYASALSSAAVEIDGSGKNMLDSDKVKLDLDERLMSAFNGGKKAAIIHHFQDLPPPSTLLFYKYCDHENAAFKDVSLLITVLLPEEKLETNMSFPEAEEKVRDFLLTRFFDAQDPGTMNKDKLSGLWSRIAHLVLLVGPEQEYEENGCEDL